MLMFVGACALCAVAINVVPATTFNVSGTSTPVRIIQSSAVPAFNAPSLNSGSLVNQALPAPPSANIPSSDMHQVELDLRVLGSFLLPAAGCGSIGCAFLRGIFGPCCSCDICKRTLLFGVTMFQQNFAF